MQPLQDDFRDPAAKDNSITNAATARSNLDAAITMRSAETELQSTIELRATASEIVAPKPDGSRRQSEKKTILKHFLKGFLEGKSLAPKWRKSADKSLWQPSCSHSSTIYEIQLQKTIVLRMQPQHEATLTQPFTLRERSYSCKAQWNSIGNSSTSTTCNPIYIAGMILELQITMEFHRQLIHQHHLQSHLHCGNDPTVANHNGILSTANARKTLETPFTMRNRSENDPTMIRDRSDHDPTTHETVSHPSHRRGRSSTFGDGLCMEKHRVSCICYLSKTHFVRDFLQNSIGNSSTSTTCNPIYSEGTILELQITMEFHRQLIHQHHLQPHLQCGNDPTVANHNGILSTAHARKTLETPFTMRNRSDHDPNMIRDRSDHDPTTHETVSQPSHRRGRSSRFGDGLCMEKHRVSCICYLSKTHFVRDFLQNSIGNSSTSTTCNPIYSEGTILELQITMEFHRQLIHQHHLQPHLQCGNDPTVANHNGILLTAHARKTLETPFTMRNRSENDPTMIRDRSDHDPTTHETVSQPSHRRGRSSRFGDGLCMEKHRVSCICYLSKTHFVRDFLQNSIGNSSTSTTCNPIYSEGTILELQITMEFHRQLIHQHHLQPHLQCGNDPTVANHNGILSTAHARKTLETPFTMRNRSDHDPNMIRDRSDHDPTTHETVSQPSHRRGRSSRFGDGLCMEKHRVSCICYLSKTHFVRDFLQNSIGNSSTSTTCNPIYSEGTISLLTLSVTNSFPH